MVGEATRMAVGNVVTILPGSEVFKQKLESGSGVEVVKKV